MKGICVVAAIAVLFVPLSAQAQKAAPASPNWITAKNKPCKIWNPQPQPHETVTWSGACKNGLATGKGVLHWTENGVPDAVFEGIYANGKRNGPGVITTPDGQRSEGNWVDDEAVESDGNAI